MTSSYPMPPSTWRSPEMACGCPFEAIEALPTRPAPRGRGDKRGLRTEVSPRLDRSALRTLLNSRAEVLEAMANGDAGPKATGRPTANVSVLWKFYTNSVYRSGDLPAIATREALQNAVDSIRAAVKKRQIARGDGRFDVQWDGDSRTLTFADNGIGMSTQDILDRFLSLGTSGKGGAADSDEAAGGFGVAKAVILGTSKTFRWEMHTRDNRVVSHGDDQDIEIFELSPPIQGTVLRIFDVSQALAGERYDYVTSTYQSMAERIRAVLGGCDLDDIQLRFNGEVVPRHFSRRRGSRLADDAPWGKGTKARVRGHRRGHGDRKGGYWVRLNGLYQFRKSSDRGNLPADIVVDLTTTVRPGQEGYPLNAARDALQGEAGAQFYMLRREIERENESAGDMEADEVFEPEGAGEIGAGDAMMSLSAEVFEDPDLRSALEAASGGLADLLDAMGPQVRKTQSSSAPPSSSAFEVPVPSEESPPGTPEVIKRFLIDADTRRQAALEQGEMFQPSLSPALARELDKAATTGELSRGAVHQVSFAVRRAIQDAQGPGGGGIAQLAVLPKVQAAVLALSGDLATPPTPQKPKGPKKPSNPFGILAGLRVSKRFYDRRKAKRFISRWKESIPGLILWDSTLRMIAAEAGIKRAFKPGWVLNDEVGALAEARAGKMPVIYLHPDRLKEMAKAHKTRPMAIAGYLHGTACHELAHLDGRMGQGHDESYVAAREELGDSTAHLLPAIAILATKLLKLKPPPTQEGKVIQRLERQIKGLKTAKNKKTVEIREELALAEVSLRDCRESLKEAKAQSAQSRKALDAQGPCGCGCGGSKESDLPDVLPDGAQSERAKERARMLEALEKKDAARFVELVKWWLSSHPPAGLHPQEINEFFLESEGRLEALVNDALGIPPAFYPEPEAYPPSMATPNHRAIYRAVYFDEYAALDVVQAVESNLFPDWRTNLAATGLLKEAIYNTIGEDVQETERLYRVVRDETDY